MVYRLHGALAHVVYRFVRELLNLYRDLKIWPQCLSYNIYFVSVRAIKGGDADLRGTQWWPDGLAGVRSSSEEWAVICPSLKTYSTSHPAIVQQLQWKSICLKNWNHNRNNLTKAVIGKQWLSGLSENYFKYLSQSYY